MGAIYILIGILLLIMSIEDIKDKKVTAIYLILLGILTVLGCGLCVHNMEKSYLSFLYMPIPGILLIALAFVTDKSIGKADGLILTMLSLVLKEDTFILAIAISFGVLFTVATIIMFSRKMDRSSRIPMVPFVTVGTICGLVAERIMWV